MKSLYLLLLVLFALAFADTSSNKVLLKNVQSVTLHRNSYTTGRRNAAVPQLVCVGGSARSESNKVETVQCTNTGFNGKDYNWKCEAQLPVHLKLGKVSVNCEGYNYPNDPYVLIGSCGMEYTLEYSGVPEYQSPRVSQPVVRRTTTYHHRDYTDDVGSAFIFVLCVVLVIMSLSYCCATARMCGRPTMTTCPVNSGRVYGPMDDYVVHQHVTPVAPVVVMPQQSTTSAFVDGMVVGSAMSHRHVPTHTHTHTETFTAGPTTNTDSDSSHTSTAYGETKRR